MNPFFSIVIPTYNRAHLIEYTINSILKQRYKDYEIIIIDDGSLDNTRDLIEAIYSENKNISYYHKENEERGAARNYGFKKAVGEFVIFLDSDDLLTEFHLYYLYNVINNNPSINFIATKYEIRKNEKIYRSEIENIKEGFHGINIVLKGNPLACNFAVRRKNKNIKLFREEKEFVVIEDWVFLVENLMTDLIYIEDKYSVIMTDHDQRSVRGNQSKIINSRIFSLNWLLNKYIFKKSEKKIIIGHSYYFCAIHSYIDGCKFAGLKYLLKSIKYLGIELRSIILGVKILLGKKLLERLKEVNIK
jgi:GalNAc5-diNAcBac-PP-undecaprenol beta-1,3-glucosyltransferase